MRMTSPKRVRLIYVFLPLLILSNLAYLTHNVFGWMLTLAFFMLVPGYLVARRLVTTKALGGVGRLSLSVGVSLTLLTVCGLALNSLHFFGLAKPLQTLNIFVALDIMTIALLAINWSTYLHIQVSKPNFSHKELVFGALFTLLPLLSIFGAIRLNNGASNILTMIFIALTGLLYLLLMLLPTMKRLYPYAIFMTAVAILFSISLRGWSITGHDIHHEYGVFTAVLNTGFWSPSAGDGDPYNACLSITILPTILAKITGIPFIFIYKIVFQVAFAAIVPALYLFARKFATEKKALLGVFAFMTFPTFIGDLPFLNRQEIAFGYFILILFVNFMDITYRAKSALTVLLLLGIILSHYSTSYVTISILLLASVVYKILSVLYKNPARLKIPVLSLPIIIMGFLATFAWNVQVTQSSSNLSNTLTSALNGLRGQNDAQVKSGSYGIVPNTEVVTPAEQLAEKAIKAKVPATYVPDDLVPLTGLGKILSKIVDVPSVNIKLHDIIAKLLQLLVVLGTVVLLLYYRKHPANEKDIYILSASISFLVALVLFTFLPQLSIGYDVTRLFQQAMTVLWLPTIFACEALFFWLGRYKLAASASLLVLIYFNLSSFMPQLTGGYLPKLVLNNSGLYYDYFYTHKSDLIGTQWLASNRIRYMNVFMDINSAAPPLGYPVALGILNGKPQGYYYTDYANNNTGRYRTILSSGFAEYTNPAFTDNKSLVYTNNQSKIYFTWPTP